MPLAAPSFRSCATSWALGLINYLDTAVPVYNYYIDAFLDLRMSMKYVMTVMTCILIDGDDIHRDC